MVARIASHRARRGDGWSTLEAPHDLAKAVLERASVPSLVDCLTLWLSNILLTNADIEREISGLEDALRAPATQRVLISNEVGSGIVPDNPLGRRFRDLQGELNGRVAALADCVVLMVAGVPLIVKGRL